MLATVPGILWTVRSMIFVASPFVRGPAYTPGPLWPGDPNKLFYTTDVGSQLQVLFHRPLLFLSLPLQAWRPEELQLRIMEMVGVLGQLDVVLPHIIYLLWYVAVTCALLAAVVQTHTVVWSRIGAAFVGLGVIVLSCIAVYDCQYLSWTTVGALNIDGVQGRYRIPLLAFVVMALPGLRAVSHQPLYRLSRALSRFRRWQPVRLI